MTFVCYVYPKVGKLRMSKYIPTPGRLCSTAVPPSRLDDVHKKRMPNIVTYLSDDGEDSDDDFECDAEDYKSLARCYVVSSAYSLHFS